MWYLNVLGLVLIFIVAWRTPANRRNVINGLLLILGGALAAS